MVVGAQRLCGRPRRTGFVHLADVVADRERLDGRRRVPGGERGDEGGVHSTAEKDADRDVGDHPAADRTLQQPPRLGDELGPPFCRARLARRRRPVGANRRTLPAGLPRQKVAGRKLAHPAQDRVWTGDVAEDEERVDRSR